MRAIAKDLSVRYKSWPEFSRELAQTYRHLELPTDGITDTQKFEAIKNIPFFDDFNDIETWEIVRISSWHRHPPGKDIIKQGDVGENFYLMVEGDAVVKKSGRVVDELRANDCFGELLYFEKIRQPRATTITSSSDLTLVKIKAHALQEATDALQKQFNKSFLRILVNRLAQVNDRRRLPN